MKMINISEILAILSPICDLLKSKQEQNYHSDQNFDDEAMDTTLPYALGGSNPDDDDYQDGILLTAEGARSISGNANKNKVWQNTYSILLRETIMPQIKRAAKRGEFECSIEMPMPFRKNLSAVCDVIVGFGFAAWPSNEYINISWVPK